MTCLSSEFVEVAFAQAWQIAVLAILVAFLVRQLCPQRPHLAYALWMVVILKCLTPPLWSSPVGLFSWVQADERPVEESSEGVLTWITGLFSPADAVSPERAGRSAQDADVAPSMGRAAAGRRWHWSVKELAPWVWLTGSMLMSGAFAYGLLRCRRVIARNRSGRDPAFERRVAELAARLGIRQPIGVVLTDEPMGPAVFGIFRPTLILPRTLVTACDFDKLAPIIAHELVHVARRDAVMTALQVSAQIVWWFFPLVWWAGRQATRERERCCDAETVARLGCRPAHYARCLLDVLEHKQELRTPFLLTGLRPVEITSIRLEGIMKRANTSCRRTPHYCWAIAVLMAFVVLPGSPLVIETAAQSKDGISAAELQDKLARLESATWQAGLSPDETKAFLKLAERVECDEKVLMKLQAQGKLSDMEAKAMEKLIQHFGNPLEDELAKLRQAGQQAGLTEDEQKAAEKTAVREGFDEKAIAVLFETGKLSDEEARAFEKLVAHLGHPFADELQKLAELAKQAGLTEPEAQTLKKGFVRAGCDVQGVMKLKNSGKLSKAEAAALEKLEAHTGKLEHLVDGPRDERLEAAVKLAKLAGATPDESDALVALLKRVDFEGRGVVELKKSGTLSDRETAVLTKLEGILGDLDAFADNPQQKPLRDLLQAALDAELSREETAALLKLAVLVEFDHRVAKRLKDAGRLTDEEARAFEKVEGRIGQ